MSIEQLTKAEINALHTALDDEYLSWTTYDQVIQDFGEIRPFINIRNAEARHINALSRLYEQYGIAMPTNPYIGRVDRYENVHEACKAAVEGEIANGDMYDELFRVTTREDILHVLRNLQEASLERHLPAFQRCVDRGEGDGEGQGMSKGRGKGRA